MQTAIIGYPYIGENQEWVTIQERYRLNKISSNEFKQQQIDAMMTALQKQKELGLDTLTIGDHPMLDRMLETAFMFNLIPSRFKEQYKQRTLELYFDMAYGQSAEKCTLNNWFSTAYCYVEPEFEEQQVLGFKDLYFKEVIQQCKRKLNCIPRVTLIGPMTFFMLTKGINKSNKKAYRDMLLTCYVQVVEYLEALGVEWVQLEEPALAYSLNSSEIALVRYFYHQISENSNCKVMLTVPYEMPQHVQALVDLPIAGIGLDVSKTEIPQVSVREDLVLALGIVDATNIWSLNETEKLTQLKHISMMYPRNELWLQTAASLMHVPVTKKEEWLLVRDLFKALSFADEKISELVQLKKRFNENEVSVEVIQRNQPMDKVFNAPLPFIKTVRSNSGRRWRLQQAFFQLPQTVFMTNDFCLGNVRKPHEQFLCTYTANVIDFPAYVPCPKDEMIGLVAEQLQGVANTQRGYILISFYESFKPPIQYDDIQWTGTIYASRFNEVKKSCSHHVKVVMPGPITMVKSAFLRQDMPYERVLGQMVQAMMLEIQALEQKGLQMLQLDESWLYRKLPVKLREQQKQAKMDLEMLHRCIYTIHDMTLVQVNTIVWKRNYYELLKSKLIDIVSFNEPDMNELLNIYGAFKLINVAISVDLSWFIEKDALDFAKVNAVKNYLEGQMLWVNVDVPQKDLNQYNMMLKLFRQERPKLDFQSFI